MNDAQRALAQRLFDIGAVKFGAFKLKLHETNPDAPLSPIYLNIRTPENPKPGPLSRSELHFVGGVLAGLVRGQNLEFDGIAGIPNAGDPIVDAFQKTVGGSFPLLRMQKKTGADSRRVTDVIDDAGLAKGSKVLVFDDLIAGADSKLEAIAVLEGAGFKVTDVVVLVDREQGGRDQLSGRGYTLHAALKLTELLDFYVDEGLIEAAKREEVKEYLAAATR